MSEPQGNGPKWRVEDQERRISKLEGYNPAEITFRLTLLEKRVDAMTKAAWSVAGAIVLAAITFALSIASGQLG